MEKNRIVSIIVLVITLIITLCILMNTVSGSEAKATNNIGTLIQSHNIILNDIPEAITEKNYISTNMSEEVSERQKIAEEKEKFSQNPTNIITSSDVLKEESLQLQNSSEAQVNNSIISNVMNRFYSNEYRTICENIRKQISESKEIGNVSESVSALLLCDLMIDILENKSITEEEKSVLIDYLQGESSNIRNNKEAKEKINMTIERIMKTE